MSTSYYAEPTIRALAARLLERLQDDNFKCEELDLEEFEKWQLIEFLSWICDHGLEYALENDARFKQISLIVNKGGKR